MSGWLLSLQAGDGGLQDRDHRPGRPQMPLGREFCPVQCAEALLQGIDDNIERLLILFDGRRGAYSPPACFN